MRESYADAVFAENPVQRILGWGEVCEEGGTVA